MSKYTMPRRTPFRIMEALDKASHYSDLAGVDKAIGILVWDIRDIAEEIALHVSQGETAKARETRRQLIADMM